MISALGKLRWEENAKDGGPAWAIYIYSETVSERHKYYLNEARSIFSSEYSLLSV